MQNSKPLEAALLELLSASQRPLPAAQLAAELDLPVPQLLEILTELLASGKVEALRSASRVAYGLRVSSDSTAATTDEPGVRNSRWEPAGLDNTRKRLF